MKDALPEVPLYAPPCSNRSSSLYRQPNRRGLYGHAGSFFAAPLQPRRLHRGAAKSLLNFCEFPYFRLHSAFSWDILILICYFRGEISV